MMRLLSLASVVWFAALPAAAQVPTPSERLFDALGMPEIIAIMAEEGDGHGDGIAESLFPGRNGDGWEGVVAAIYDAERMEDVARTRFAAELGGRDLAPLLDFFESERGQRIVELEISARRAFLDEEIEDAAEDAVADLATTEPGRYALLERFIEANDLVGSNVMGAMNSNYAFYLGLADGGAFDGSLTEAEILADVWAQEAEIRNDTEGWVYAYLGLAYEPLADEDIEAYIALSETPRGRALNGALFAAFDEMYNGISRALGQAAARFMSSEDI